MVWRVQIERFHCIQQSVYSWVSPDGEVPLYTAKCIWVGFLSMESRSTVYSKVYIVWVVQMERFYCIAKSIGFLSKIERFPLNTAKCI